MLDGISKRLKLARTVAGYKTAKEFTKKFNIPLSTYSNHENNKRKMSLETVKNYADILKVDLCWMLTGNNHNDSRAVIDNTDENALTQIEIEGLTKAQERAGFKRRYLDLSINAALLADIIEILKDKAAQLTLELNHKELAFVSATIYQNAIENDDLLSANKSGFLSHSCQLMLRALSDLG